ncbi:hypothetical protein MOX67_003058 [Escherichia coli]|nr:hypothetical protein [Escherichia coli]
MQCALGKPRQLKISAYVRAFVHQAKPFYFGDNDTGWTADFDYLLREDSLTGVREGKFADRGIA